MTIQRYLVKDLALTFFATFFILLLIIVGNMFVRILAKVSTGDLPVDVLGKMVLLGSIEGGLELIPVALLIGLLLAFGRFYQDHEMSAMYAAGIGPKAIYQGIYLFVLPLTLFVGVMVLFVLPFINGLNEGIKDEVKARPEAAGIPIAEFAQSGSGSRRFTLFVEALDENQALMQRFFMHTKEAEKESVVLAQSAILFIDEVNGDRVLTIKNGSRYDREFETEAFNIFSFGEHGVRVPPLEVTAKKDYDLMSTGALLADDSSKASAEFHKRLAVILTVPIMAFIAFPLSYAKPREGKFGKLALGVLVFAVYYNLLITGESLIAKEDSPAWLGLWWVHALFILFGWMLLKWRFGIRRTSKKP